MIQVIDRTFQIIELIKEHRSMSLLELETELGINKGTLCNILRTLTELGYVWKGKRNEYTIGPKMFDLTSNDIGNNTIMETGRQIIQELVKETQEGAVAVIRKNTQFYKYAKAYCSDIGITMEDDIIPTSIYNMASSWTLLAYQPIEDIRQLIQYHELPESRIHGDITNNEQLLEALAKTAQQEIYNSSSRKNDIEIQGIAVPISGPDGRILSAIGIYVPKHRYSGSYKNHIIKSLKSAKKKMEKQLK
jgi:DNA-binding IclR family transcriptional regulator